MKNSIQATASNYESLTQAEQWDYCWEADLAQEGLAEAALEQLPAESLYRQDLALVLLSQEEV